MNRKVVAALIASGLIAGLAWATGVNVLTYYHMDNRGPAWKDTLVCLAKGDVDTVQFGFIADRITVGTPSDSVARRWVGNPASKLSNGLFSTGSADNPWLSGLRVNSQLDTLTSSDGPDDFTCRDEGWAVILTGIDQSAVSVRVYAVRRPE